MSASFLTTQNRIIGESARHSSSVFLISSSTT
jgi:hypothetical protein